MKRVQVLLRKARRTLRRLVHKWPAKSMAHDQTNLAHAHTNGEMCYAQMGGMMVATFITLLLVPVIYSIFVLDLKLVRWEKT
jgi:hypothetical protein